MVNKRSDTGNDGNLWRLLCFACNLGIGNVFSNTLGFVRQRKREFARYMFVGVMPEEIRKMFCIEALVIAGRPILFTLPLILIYRKQEIHHYTQKSVLYFEIAML